MPELYIGLMSGTSLDAIDGALVDFGAGAARTLAFLTLPMPQSLRRELSALQSPGADELDRAARAAVALTDLYAQLAAQLASTWPASAVRAVGAHGQTVRHRPELGYTLQLIDGARLAERCAMPVVCDFRSADIAAGGQGAPLVPAFHADAFGDARTRRAIVNIGGIANVSLLSPAGAVTGFDTGPGNLLMDAWCERHTGEAFDRDGRWAAGGQVEPDLLQALLAEPYFERRPPKSTGRDLFHSGWLDAVLARRPAPIPAADVQATLAELTAITIGRACRAFDAQQVFVCGGGAHNALLMQRLGRHCDPATVQTTQALGAPPQAVEAVAFAWLAARRLAGRPGNLPAVTGARGPRVLGALYPAPTA